MRFKSTEDVINSCLEYARRIEKVCLDILSGKTIKKSCEDNSVPLHKFRSMMKDSSLEVNYTKLSNKELDNFLLTTEEKFVYDLFEIPYSENVKMVDDIDKAFSIAIKDLDEFESDVLKKYYFDEMTLKQIAETYSKSISEIDRVRNNGLKHLRHPNRITYFVDGVDSKKRELRDERDNLGIELYRLEQLRKMLNSELTNLNLSSELVDKLVANNFTNLSDISNLTNTDFINLRLTNDEIFELVDYLDKNINSKEILSVIPIERLGLLPRVSNFLLRRGITTVQEVIDCDVYTLKGFGDFYRNELFSVLEARGIHKI